MLFLGEQGFEKGQFPSGGLIKSHRLAIYGAIFVPCVIYFKPRTAIAIRLTSFVPDRTAQTAIGVIKTVA
jgi:hypothetical protein